jgi:hypothetical protein
LSSVSLTDRLFWPTVAFATLALGGFGYFAATKLFRAAPPTVAWAPLDRVSRSHSTSETESAAPAGVEVALVTEAAPAEGPAAVEEPAPAGPTAADAMDAEDPYKVPTHKPFIDAQTFAKKAPPRPVAPPKKPVVAAKGTPGKATPVAMTKPAAPAAPAAKVPLSSDIKVPAIPAAPAPPTYVMNDGRRIAAVKVVDLGEFWGLKTPSGQIVSVRKEDVKEIAR